MDNEIEEARLLLGPSLLTLLAAGYSNKVLADALILEAVRMLSYCKEPLRDNAIKSLSKALHETD